MAAALSPSRLFRPNTPAPHPADTQAMAHHCRDIMQQLPDDFRAPSAAAISPIITRQDPESQAAVRHIMNAQTLMRLAYEELDRVPRPRDEVDAPHI